MVGKIIKGIAGFYYVHTRENGTYECKAKGIFRNRNEKPLVGDMVDIEILSETPPVGNITAILPRNNRLIRPAVANVDQALVVFAVNDPEPNLNLLDCFLLRMGYEDVPVVICFNKSDLDTDNRLERLCAIYEGSGCNILTICAGDGQGKEDLFDILKGKTTVLAGPSGVGKSTIMNMICPEAAMETGAISVKLGRGKHTTRHSEIFSIGQDSYLMDTPGFSSLQVPDMEITELDRFFPEFNHSNNCCRFMSCVHKDEPDCVVKSMVENLLIPRERYESYLYMLEELKQRKKW